MAASCARGVDKVTSEMAFDFLADSVEAKLN